MREEEWTITPVSKTLDKPKELGILWLVVPYSFLSGILGGLIAYLFIYFI